LLSPGEGNEQPREIPWGQEETGRIREERSASDVERNRKKLVHLGDRKGPSNPQEQTKQDRYRPGAAAWERGAKVAVDVVRRKKQTLERK